MDPETPAALVVNDRKFFVILERMISDIERQPPQVGFVAVALDHACDRDSCTALCWGLMLRLGTRSVRRGTGSASGAARGLLPRCWPRRD